MEWYESEDRALFAETAAKYAAWTLKSIVEEKLTGRTTADEFNPEIIRQAAAAGLLTAPLPEDQGGAGLDGLGRAIVLERMARGRAGAAVILAAHWTGLSALSSLPNQEKVGSWLAERANQARAENPWLCGVAVPAAVKNVKDGLDPQATESGEKVMLSGEWTCPLHPSLVERLAIAVPPSDGDPKVLWLFGKDLAPYCQNAFPGTGLLELPTCRLVLQSLEAPAGDVLARGDQALAITDRIWRELYLGLAAVMVGNAAAAFAYAWEYARERVQTGRLIIEHQEVRRMLEHMNTLVEAAWAMVTTAAAVSDSRMALDRSRRAYTFCGSAGEQVCLDAIQCLGGYGYMEDYGLERRLRDVKSIQCLLGSHSLDWIGERC